MVCVVTTTFQSPKISPMAQFESGPPTSTIGTALEAYSIIFAMKNTLLQNGLQDCSLEVDNVGGVKIVSVLQRLIDHVVIRKTCFPFNALATSSLTISGLSWLRRLGNY